MRRLSTLPQIVPLALLLLSGPWAAAVPLAAAAQSATVEEPPSAPPGAPPNRELFPGVTATPAPTRFPGVSASPMSATPLSALPYVYALKRRRPEQMLSEDSQLVASLDQPIKQQAALMSFDISQPGWSYEQVVCPALPDYLLLSFVHGSDPSGSSRFTAILDRDNSRVEIVSTYAHGLKPFTAAWSKPATFGLFNRMLQRERGPVPLGAAPNWLVIGLCYAEISGYPVQALTSIPQPGPTMDMERLKAALPQMQIAPDKSALVSFDDVSQPAMTTAWSLGFNKRGEIVSVDRTTERQPAKIALRP